MISPEKKIRNILAYNYLNKRFSEDKMLQKSLKISLDRKIKGGHFDEDEFEPIDKIIVIVGAGASLGASLKLGDEAKIDLIEELTSTDENSSKLYRQLFIDELKKNLLKKGSLELAVETDDNLLIKNTDFESVIETLSQFIGLDELVRDRLNYLFRARHNPILSYEILAHMLKYKMIDGIINYNFDELLDQSIEEELYHNEYVKVIGSNDFHKYNERIEEIIRQKKIIPNSKKHVSFYFKPHGTFSDKDSLRYTKSSYVENLGFNPILENELRGNVAFWVIGFDMNSVELNKIIIEHIKNNKLINPQFFFLKIKPDGENNFDIIKRILPNYKNYDLGSFYPYNSEYDTKIEKGKPDTISPKIIEHIFNDTYELLKHKYEVTKNSKEIISFPIWDIYRHKVICELFGNLECESRIKNNQQNVDADSVLFEDYFYLRLLVEVLISIAKGRSMINILGVSKDRLGQLYELYFRHSVEPVSLRKICDKFNLINTSYSNEAFLIAEEINPYYLKEKNPSIKELDFKFTSVSVELISKLLTEIRKRKKERQYEKNVLEHKLGSENYSDKELEKLESDLECTTRVVEFITRLENRINTPDVKDYLVQYINTSFDCVPEISHKFPTRNHILFDDISTQNIYSYEQMTYHIKMAINKKEFDTILFSTSFLFEEWFELFHGLGKKTYIICEKKPINIRYYNSKKSHPQKVLYLNWWEHHRNYLILVKDKIPIWAMHFYHGNNQLQISPIIVDNFDKCQKKENILKSMLECFLAYRIKAKNTPKKDDPITWLSNTSKDVELVKKYSEILD